MQQIEYNQENKSDIIKIEKAEIATSEGNCLGVFIYKELLFDNNYFVHWLSSHQIWLTKLETPTTEKMFFLKSISRSFMIYFVCISSQFFLCPVGWGCRIHWLHFCWGVRPPPTIVMDMTLNNLMVRLL